MFHGLDDIDWASFGKHIVEENSSEDIPRWIRELLSDDPRTRLFAQMNLLSVNRV